MVAGLGSIQLAKQRRPRPTQRPDDRALEAIAHHVAYDVVAMRRAEDGDERDPAMREFLEGISPNRHAQRTTVALLVAQAANDPRVPFTELEQMIAAVRANGRPVWYMKALDEGHGFQKRQNQELFNRLVALFWERHLVGTRGGELRPPTL